MKSLSKLGRRRQQRKRQKKRKVYVSKTTTLHLHHAFFFFRHIGLLNFTRPLYEDGEDSTKIFFFFPKLRYGTFGLNPR